MPKLAEFRDAFAVTPNTIRNWCTEFAPYLSDGANPPTGERRRFTDNDAAVFALVASMRADDKPYEVIRARLNAGDRGAWPPAGQGVKEDAMHPPGARQAAQDEPHEAQRSAAVQSDKAAENIALRAQNQLLREELEYYRNRSEELQGRAVAAETQLMLLGAGDDTAVSPPEPEPSPEPRSPSERLRAAWLVLRGK